MCFLILLLWNYETPCIQSVHQNFLSRNCLDCKLVRTSRRNQLINKWIFLPGSCWIFLVYFQFSKIRIIHFPVKRVQTFFLVLFSCFLYTIFAQSDTSVPLGRISICSRVVWSEHTCTCILFVQRNLWSNTIERKFTLSDSRICYS